MKRLLAQLEAERKKLNELGVESLEQGIPLTENKAVQAQSQKIDQLIVRLKKKMLDAGSISDSAEVKEDGVQWK